MTGDPHHDLWENAPCGQFTTSADGAIVAVNDTFLKMTGHRREDVLGRPFEQFLAPGSQLYLHTHYQQALLVDGAVSEVLLSLMHTNGTAMPVLVYAKSYEDRAGTPGWVHATVTDASKQQNYARDLLRARRATKVSEQRVAVLEGASIMLGIADSETTLASAVSDIVRRAFDAFTAELVVISGDSALVPDGRDSVHRVPLDALWPREGRTGGVVSVLPANVATTHPAWGASLVNDRVESLTVAPLFEGDSIVALIVCSFRRHRTLDAGAREMLTALTRYAAQALKSIRLQDTLRDSALHDPLTGLANRRLLEQRLDHVLAAAVRYERPMALLYLDLDGFKAINDTLGHARGDDVLAAVADGLTRVIRRTDTIARIGGDEFIIVCSDAGPEEVAEVVGRIQQEFGAGFNAVSGDLPLTVSIGVALRTPGDRTSGADDLTNAADAAMYRSKAAGKNRATTVTLPTQAGRET